MLDILLLTSGLVGFLLFILFASPLVLLLSSVVCLNIFYSCLNILRVFDLRFFMLGLFSFLFVLSTWFSFGLLLYSLVLLHFLYFVVYSFHGLSLWYSSLYLVIYTCYTLFVSLVALMFAIVFSSLSLVFGSIFSSVNHLSYFLLNILWCSIFLSHLYSLVPSLYDLLTLFHS
jgi:hypothetical protein